MSIEDSIKSVIDEQVRTTINSYVQRLSSENNSLQQRVEWTEQQLNVALERLNDHNKHFEDGELSGDKISGGTITDFRSTGIRDSADKIKLQIENNQVVVESDLEVKGTVRVKELQYYKAKCDDLDVENSVRIKGNEVLWRDRLGNSVKSSKLQEVGVLKEINVANTLTVFKNKVGINGVEPDGVFGVFSENIETIIDTVGDVGFVGTSSSNTFGIGTNREPTLFISHDNKVGIKIKKPKADLDVAGYIRYQGQTHQYSDSKPVSGNWSLGDIVWNSNPVPGGSAGWICVKAGEPGSWKTFAVIGN